MHARLQVLGGLCQAQRVEAAVPWQRAVQPRWPLGVGQPQGIACARHAGTLLGEPWQTRASLARPKELLQACEARGVPPPDLPPALRVPIFCVPTDLLGTAFFMGAATAFLTDFNEGAAFLTGAATFFSSFVPPCLPQTGY